MINDLNSLVKFMTPNTSKKQPSLDYISFEIYQKLFKLVFCHADQNSIWDLNCNNFEKNNLVSLLWWPIIIAKRYLFPHLEMEIFKKQCDLNQILDKDFKLDSIRKVVSISSSFAEKSNSNNLSKTDDPFLELNFERYDFIDLADLCSQINSNYNENIDINSLIRSSQKIPSGRLIDLFVGGKPNARREFSSNSSKMMKRCILSILIDQIIETEYIGDKIRNGIFHYYIVFFIFLSRLNDDRCFDACLTFEAMAKIFQEYFGENDENFDAYNLEVLEIISCFGSHLFSDAIKFFLYEYNDIFLKKGVSEKCDIERHKFCEDNPYYFASCYKVDDENDDEYGQRLIDVEREINLFEEFGYKLEFWFQKNLSTLKFTDMVIFKYAENKNISSQLLHCLTLIAHELSVQIHEYSNNYSKFISNAYISVDNNLDKFLENIDIINNSYHLFSEFIEQKDFSRAIESLDMDLQYKCIEETRNAIKKKKKNHLSPELVQDLLTANKEIAILYCSVQRKHDAIKNKIARKFFEGNPQHFQVTEFDDIKDVDFSSNPNGIRDTRRKIFYNIVKRWGKDIAGSKIAKELALE
jgi:hypothetical protein